jgi:hypothetical protein
MIGIKETEDMVETEEAEEAGEGWVQKNVLKRRVRVLVRTMGRGTVARTLSMTG